MAARTRGARRPPNHSPFAELTPRDLEVVDLIAAGLANQDIAEQLSISPRSARNYVTHIFSKIGASHRAEAIIRAREAAFGREDT